MTGFGNQQVEIQYENRQWRNQSDRTGV